MPVLSASANSAQDTHNFPNALRAALRKTPDILLVGEMRDLETMRLAIKAAETGHLVFATVHTSSAAQTVERIVNVFPVEEQEQIRVMLSNNLVAVLTQQLIVRATGGRVCAQEIMIASPAIRNLIREAKAHQINSIIQTSAHLGMKTMDQCLRDLYNQGMITYTTALERAMNVEELKKMMLSDGTLPEGCRFRIQRIWVTRGAHAVLNGDRRTRSGGLHTASSEERRWRSFQKRHAAPPRPRKPARKPRNSRPAARATRPSASWAVVAPVKQRRVGKVKGKDLTMFCRQFSTMVGAGVAWCAAWRYWKIRRRAPI